MQSNHEFEMVIRTIEALTKRVEEHGLKLRNVQSTLDRMGYNGLRVDKELTDLRLSFSILPFLHRKKTNVIKRTLDRIVIHASGIRKWFEIRKMIWERNRFFKAREKRRKCQIEHGKRLGLTEEEIDVGGMTTARMSKLFTNK